MSTATKTENKNVIMIATLRPVVFAAMPWLDLFKLSYGYSVVSVRSDSLL